MTEAAGVERIQIDLPGWEPGYLNLPRLSIFVGQHSVGKTSLLNHLAKHYGTLRDSWYSPPPLNTDMWRLHIAAQAATRRIFFNDENCDKLDQANDVHVTVMKVCTSLYRDRVLVLDEAAASLHMTQQFALMQEIKLALETRPDLRVILSTYSPYFLDAVPYASVFVMARDKQSCLTRARPLPEAPGFARWARGLNAGELWATMGEDWVWTQTVQGGAA